MKELANAVLLIGIVSLVVGVILRVMVNQFVLGLEPSSFLEFSIACFLLAIALEIVGKK